MKRAVPLLTLFVAMASLVALGGSSVASAGRATATAEAGVGPAHWYRPGAYGSWGDVPARPEARRSFLAIDPLANPGNGEIMPTTRTHVIFWLPAGFHYSSANGDASYESTVLRYFQDVGGSQILNTTTQYTGNNGTPSDTSTFIDSIVDTTAFPHSGADVAHAVTQNDINQEVFNQIGAHSGWNLGLSDMYFVFLPNNLVDCDNTLTSCNTNKYCAYHTYGFSGSDTPANDFVWADIPDDRSVYSVVAGCGDSNVTGDESADTTLSSTEHEHMEAITDPRLNAWQDSTGGGGENGDKCNRNMGVANSSSTTPDAFMSGDTFRIQREWSNAAAFAGPAANGCAASYTTTGSHVVAPVPTGGDVTASVTEATIPGNNGDALHYHVSFHDPSDQDDAFSISDGAAYASRVSGPGSIGLGDLSPHQTANGAATAGVTGGPLLDGTVLTTTFTTAFDDSTGTARPTIVRTATTTVDNAPPTLNLPGPQTQDFDDALGFGISASDANAGDTVTLSASGLPAGLGFTDNGNRTGTVSGTVMATPGVYVATFTANDHHHLSLTTGTVQITVTREETTTAYTGVTGPVLDGSTVTLSGVLKEDGVVPLAGRTLTMTLGSGGGAQTCVGSTDGTGSASCSILVNQPVGPQPVSAAFAGDTFYLPSSGADTVVVFTAMSLKQDVLAQANALLPGATHQDSDKLKDIIKKLTAALDPSLWVDGNHVDSQHGDQVFDSEKDAVGKLTDLQKNGSIPVATLQGMINKLVQADQILANDALADSIAASGDPHKIAEAQTELGKAADELAKNDPSGAIDHYKNAWKNAQQAVHH